MLPTQVHPLEEDELDELLEEDDEELEDELDTPDEEHLRYDALHVDDDGVEPIIQQLGFPLKHFGVSEGNMQDGVPPVGQNIQPLEEDEELLEDELDEEGEVLQTIFWKVLPVPLLLKHPATPLIQTGAKEGSAQVGLQALQVSVPPTQVQPLELLEEDELDEELDELLEEELVVEEVHVN